MSVTDRLLDNDRARPEAFASRPQEPAPRRVAVVACMGARMDVHAILGLREGEAPVIRHAGGAVTEDVVRSLLVDTGLPREVAAGGLTPSPASGTLRRAPSRR